MTDEPSMVTPAAAISRNSRAWFTGRGIAVPVFSGEKFLPAQRADGCEFYKFLRPGREDYFAPAATCFSGDWSSNRLASFSRKSAFMNGS